MKDMPEVVLVPVDGSEGANHAARFAAGIAQALNRPMRLLFAFPQTAVDLFGIPSEAPNRADLRYFSPEEFEKLRDRTAEQVFRAAREAIGDDAVAVEEHVLSGEPADAILEYAEQVSGAMIVVGSRGLSRIRRLMLGSLSQQIVQHAHCPVTVVR